MCVCGWWWWRVEVSCVGTSLFFLTHPAPSTPSYLDASCLIFGPNRQFIEVVDYQSKRNTARSGADGAVRHSGDMLRSVLCEGTHTISVDLDRLEPGVSELFISLSAWAGARLGEIQCPRVALTNGDTRAPLCEYRLEGVPKDALDTYSSVVMCRVFRGAAGPGGAPGGWQVEAIGQLGHGHADAYDPLLHCIRHELALADTLAGWKM